MKKFQSKHKTPQETEEDFQAKYKRALADYQNLQRQSSQEKINTIKYGNSSLLNDILPVYEYLKMSLSHSQETSSVVDGLIYTLNLFQKVLTDHGIIEIVTANQRFDHRSMEAVETVSTDDEGQDGLVAESRLAGYLLHDKVLRPARVVVYSFSPERLDEANQNEPIENIN